MYINWVQGKEEETVNTRYEQNAETYIDLIVNLIKVQEFARMVKKNIVKKISNCKLLSKRVLNFSLSSLKDKIKENLWKMKEFQKVSYKGFYCAICNFDNQKYFDLNKRTVDFSEKFCRDIVEHSLESLILFHVDIVKLLNLVTRLLVSCDFRGEFNVDAQFPKEHTFF
jgi:hypothetical protein